MITTLHRVKIRLRYTANGVPWKWWAECECGWKCMSWQWLREDGTGTLPMALEHLDTQAKWAEIVNRL